MYLILMAGKGISLPSNESIYLILRSTFKQVNIIGLYEVKIDLMLHKATLT